jgi:hypothetical protein
MFGTIYKPRKIGLKEQIDVNYLAVEGVGEFYTVGNDRHPLPWILL